MKRILLIMNPSAGMGAAEERLYDIVVTLAQEGCETTPVPMLLDRGLTSEKILDEEDGRFDIIACFGGDGTLHHLVDGYVAHGLTKPIGYLPAGSTNDFARSIGLPEDLPGGLQNIAHGVPTALDIGVFNDSHFNYVAAFGAFTKVSYETNQAFKNLLGYAAYIISALWSVGESVNVRCPMTVEHDGVRTEGSYIFGAVSNSTSIAGFKVPFDQEVSMSDGILEAILVRAPENLMDFTQIVGCLMAGTLDCPFIETFQAREIHIHSASKAAWTLDGEFGGEPEDVHISVLQKRLSLLLPAREEAAPEGQTYP